MNEFKTKYKPKSWIQIKKLVKLTVSSLLLLNLTACATYKSSFNCGDAKGVYCTSMDNVDQMIKSGEIERFNEAAKRQKYKAMKGADIPKREAAGNKKLNGIS